MQPAMEEIAMRASIVQAPAFFYRGLIADVRYLQAHQCYVGAGKACMAWRALQSSVPTSCSVAVALTGQAASTEYFVRVWLALVAKGAGICLHCGNGTAHDLMWQ